jgi:lipopolysaccharide/colanic/teichoic acid biosynthesis glycosyltransferase
MVGRLNAQSPLGLGSNTRGGPSPRGTFYLRHVKRILDFVFALVGLVLAFPVFVVCAAAIRLDSPGPVFYRQRRVGQHGRLFEILKLRTMVDKADEKGLKLTVSQDPRTTRVGTWLRRTKLDEIPQLINVLRGEMSFVGTRPEVPEYVAVYTDEQKRVLELKPGITGPASLAFIDEEKALAGHGDLEDFYVKTLMQRKLDLDLAYCNTVSFAGDVRLILLTLRGLLN